MLCCVTWGKSLHLSESCLYLEVTWDGKVPTLYFIMSTGDSGLEPSAPVVGIL